MKKYRHSPPRVCDINSLERPYASLRGRDRPPGSIQAQTGAMAVTNTAALAFVKRQGTMRTAVLCHFQTQSGEEVFPSLDLVSLQRKPPLCFGLLPRTMSSSLFYHNVMITTQQAYEAVLIEIPPCVKFQPSPCARTVPLTVLKCPVQWALLLTPFCREEVEIQNR